MHEITLKTDLLGLKKSVKVRLTYRNQELAQKTKVKLLKLSLKNTNDELADLEGDELTQKIINQDSESLEVSEELFDFVKAIGGFDKKNIEKIKDSANRDDIGSWVNYAVMRIQGFTEKEYQEIQNNGVSEEEMDPKEEQAS